MNKLFSSLCWYGLICLPIMQGLTLWRFIFGPLNRKICFIQIVFMNVTKWQSLLLFDAILLSRYTLVVWLKNPAAVHDDFWSIYINVLSLCIAVLVNFVIFFFPKRLPQIYYTCSNTDPTSDYQISYSEGYIEIFSIALYLLVKLRLVFYKHCQKSMNAFNPKSLTLNSIEKQNIIDLTSLILSKLAFALLALLSSKVNKLGLDEVNSFHNHLYVYTFQLIGPPLICVVTIGLQFLRHKSIRKHIANHWKENRVTCLE